MLFFCLIPTLRYSSVIDDSPSSYLPSSYADTLPTSFRSSTTFQTPKTSTAYQTPTLAASSSSYNNSNNSSNSNLRQSLSSSRLNNNNGNSSNSNGNKYGRLSRHFSFDDDANDASSSTSFHPATSSYISPENYLTLTRRRHQGEPSVVEKYFSPTSTTSSTTSMPLSRQGSTTSFESRDQTSKFPPRPSPARYVASNLSKSSSSGNANV
jgi:hypothetical protein